MLFLDFERWPSSLMNDNTTPKKQSRRCTKCSILYYHLHTKIGWCNIMKCLFYNFSAFHHDLYVEIVIEYSTFYHDFVLSVTISFLSVTISRNSITIYQPQNFPEGFCFGNPRSRSTMAPKNPKSYLENRKSYEFLNAIFDFRKRSPFRKAEKNWWDQAV